VNALGDAKSFQRIFKIYIFAGATMITITIQSENLDGVKAEMNAFLNGPGEMDAAQLKLAVPEVPKKKTKKKSKSKPSEPVSEEPTSQDDAPDAGELVSKAADLKPATVEALQTLNSEKGIEAAKEVLTAFDCKRLGELKPEQYEAFIKACAEA